MGNSSNTTARNQQEIVKNHLNEKQIYGPLSILTLTAQQRNNKIIKKKS